MSDIPKTELVFVQYQPPKNIPGSRRKCKTSRAGLARTRKCNYSRTIDEKQETWDGSRARRNIVNTFDADGVSPPASIPNSSLLDHIATSRFFHHYVSPKRTFCRLDLDFTSSVIDRAKKRSTLAEIIIALGILTLPRKTYASCLAARSRYTKALRRTNRALQDPVQAKSDEALLAVILLGLFETTPDDSHSITNWTAHLDGARMLLRIRGTDLLQQNVTYRMFSMLRQQILLNCLMTRQPVPDDVVTLSKQLSETQDEIEKAASQLIGLLARLCSLLASTSSRLLTDQNAIIAEAAALDEDLKEWSLELPRSYAYSKEPAGASMKAFADYYDVYTSIFSAEVWNFYRTARMAANGLILQSTSSEAHKKQEIRRDSHQASQDTAVDIVSQPGNRVAVVQSLREEVCASIPFMLDPDGPRMRSTPDMQLCNRTPVIHQLLFIAQDGSVPEDMLLWATERVAELKREEEMDRGAIWMSGSHSIKFG